MKSSSTGSNNIYFAQVKPLLNIVRVEDELKAKDEEIADLTDKLEKEEKLRKNYEEKCVTLLAEKNDLTLQLQAVRLFSCLISN